MPRPRPEPMWRRYLRFFGPNVEADVDDEVADHLARLEAELRERGTPEPEIAAAVRARFGDADAIRARLTRSDGRRHRRQLRLEALGSFGQDVAYALRRLRQRPGFAAAVVVVLALGVGATTAMFSAVDAAMLRPLPFANADQLLLVNDVDVPFDGGGPPLPFHPPDYNDLAGMRGTFANVASYAAGGLNLSIPDHALRLQVGVVTPSFFATIGVMPAIGRPFDDAEGRPGGARAAILSYSLWSSHFGGRPMLGSTISLNGESYTVVGVMPRGFGFPNQSDLWIPMTNPTTGDTFAAFRGYLPSYTLARTAPGVTVARAIARLHAMWRQAAEVARPRDPRSVPWFRERFDELAKSGYATPLRASLVGSQYRLALLVLLGATGLLLLIACANVTNLLLSDATARTREIALRAMLGATRPRIVRQLLTESLLLAAAGTLGGIALATPMLHLVDTMRPASLAGLAPATLDLRVLGFAFVILFGTAVGVGLWPALGAARANIGDTVKGGGGHGTTVARMGRVRLALVGGELALAAALLVGMGLSLRSFMQLMRVHSGIEPARTATLEMSLGDEARDWRLRLTQLQAMIGRLEGSPGITAAGVINDLPLRGGGGIGLTFHAEGAPPWKPGTPPVFARYFQASGDYFRAMGIPLLRGRTFSAADDSGAPRVAVIDRLMADSVWPGRDAVGRRFTMGPDTLHPITVIGVVDAVHDLSLAAEPHLQFYFPITQQTPSNVALVARGSLAPEAMLTRLRDAVHAVNPAQAVYNVRMMDEVVDASVAPQRADALLIAMFGVLALVLTALGVYAVVSYSVTRRRRELGIRAALGASRRELIGLVARQMGWVAAVGLAVGLAAAWASSRVMQSLLFGVTPHDPATFVLAPLALFVPAALATLIPARRASRANPMEVLREE